MKKRVAIVGGGAAGFFGAIGCAEADPAAEVTIYEATAQLLAKVRISGGGRCNVTHACADLREFAAHYPRGSRELLGALHRFGPDETVAWFAARGVALKTESDGRMFPVTDSSATIVTCLTQAAKNAGVRIVDRCRVTSVARTAGGSFDITLSTGETRAADCVLLASGGNKSSGGIEIARSLGHSIEDPVPSLFTFHIDDARLRGLEGLSVVDAGVSVTGSRLREHGAVLITHWGVSGPAILRLSAWGARELCAADYRFTLQVNWAFPRTREEVMSALAAVRQTHARKRIATENPFGIPARLWERLVESAGAAGVPSWAALSKAAAAQLAQQIALCEFSVTGKSMNKEEFVTCGGVRLCEVDFRTMESRVCPGLFLAGEVLDIDGVTGGFNFQAAWTTARLASLSIARWSAS